LLTQSQLTRQFDLVASVLGHSAPLLAPPNNALTPPYSKPAKLHHLQSPPWNPHNKFPNTT
jgi:hypothetical protein